MPRTAGNCRDLFGFGFGKKKRDEVGDGFGFFTGLGSGFGLPGKLEDFTVNGWNDREKNWAR